MPRSGSTFILVNPAAGRGRRRARLRAYLELLPHYLGAVVPEMTTRAGDEVARLDHALESGVDCIVAIGGDGTWSVAADRILKSGRRDVSLGLLPSGTGNDFGKSLGIRHERAEDVLQAIADRRTTTIDVGRVDGRHFLNVVGLGFDIAVIDDAEGTPLLRGDALYRFCALKQLFRFPGVHVELTADNAAPESIDALMLTVSNANYFGGSFHIAPRASLSDGRLDAVAIRNAGPLARARLFSLVSKGGHENHGDVVTRQARAFTIQAPVPIRYEVDGEVVKGGTRVQIETVPSALRVCVPENPTAGAP